MPSEVIEKELAGALVAIARVFARDRACTPVEVEVWVKHMRPVQGSSKWERTALLSYQAELVRLGLADCDVKIRRFVIGEDEGSPGADGV